MENYHKLFLLPLFIRCTVNLHEQALTRTSSTSINAYLHSCIDISLVEAF